MRAAGKRRGTRARHEAISPKQSGRGAKGANRSKGRKKERLPTDSCGEGRRKRREEGEKKGGGCRCWQLQDIGAGVETVACSSCWHRLYQPVSGLGTRPSVEKQTHARTHTRARPHMHKRIKHKGVHHSPLVTHKHTHTHLQISAELGNALSISLSRAHTLTHTQHTQRNKTDGRVCTTVRAHVCV